MQKVFYSFFYLFFAAESQITEIMVIGGTAFKSCKVPENDAMIHGKNVEQRGTGLICTVKSHSFD